MDMRQTGVKKTVPGLAIYKLDRDTLTMCVGHRKRPTEFKTGPKSETVLAVLKRVKR